MHRRFHLGHALLLVVAIIAATFVSALANVVSASDPLAWGRTYAVADSLVVPVRWSASCDARGCADGYRVTWTIKGTVDSPQPRTSPGSSSLTPPSTAPATPTPLDVVIREVTVTRTVDTARVPLPDVGLPRTVCVYVTAIRRGLSSDVRAACRTVEAPDVAPPPVDSIRWDTLGVPRATPPLLDSLHAGMALLFGAHQYAVASDSTGDMWLDSLPLTDSMYVGYAAVACSVTFLRVDSAPVVIVPVNGRYTASQLVRYRDRCGASVQREYGARPVRFVADTVTFSARTLTTGAPRERGA